MKLKLTAIAWLIFGIHAAGVLSADPPATKDATSPTAEEVSKIVHQLGVADPVDVEVAVIRLSRMAPKSFPLIVAASHDATLSPQAAARLKRFIEQQQPWQAAREIKTAALLKRSEWNQRTALASYDAVGNRNPKWDADARDGIRKYTALGTIVSGGRAELERAIAAGCDDPFILYLEARTLAAVSKANTPEVQQMYDLATKGMAKSEYPAFRKLNCYVHSFRYMTSIAFAKAGPGRPIDAQDWAKITALLNQVGTAWPDFLKEKPPEEDVLYTAKYVIDGIQGAESLRKTVFDQMDALIQRAYPGSSLALTIKGHFYIQYAWDARGGGWANTVTPDGWKRMKERLAIAEESLTKAWETDHSNSDAPTEMITVELGQGQGRNRMELWFRRAMEADPDNRPACDAKMYYLQPKWYGTPEDMLIFARQCYETHNWRGELPFVQIQVFTDLLPYVQDQNALFTSPQTWTSLCSVYEPWLRYKPNNPLVRSRYCYYAARCGHWDVAKRQFDILGDTAMARQFGGEETMKQMRETATQKGGSPAVP